MKYCTLVKTACKIDCRRCNKGVQSPGRAGGPMNCSFLFGNEPRKAKAMKTDC